MPAPVAAAAGAAAKKIAQKKAMGFLQKHGKKLIAAGAMAPFAMAMILLLPVIIFTSADDAAASGGTPAHIEGIPDAALEAYIAAESKVGQIVPACTVPWWFLAGFGKIESGHGTHGGATMDEAGNVTPHIIGIPLNGTNGTARILDTDDGVWDEDLVYDRAVGPMQFIPSTWRSSGQDGNDDGVKDPFNYFDATLAAAVYLCNSAPGARLVDEDSQRVAAFAYNHSNSYVNDVIAAAHEYRDLAAAQNSDGGTFISTDGNLTLKTVQGITVDAEIADELDSMINAARGAGFELGGGGYRSAAEQIATRRANCGTSHYDIYEKPSGQCSPPTAIPGTSQHEKGLAVDFTCNGSLIRSHNSCWSWLNNNARNYGFHPFEREPWHWSTTGR